MSPDARQIIAKTRHLAGFFVDRSRSGRWQTKQTRQRGIDFCQVCAMNKTAARNADGKSTWAQARALAAATPESRNRYVDFCCN
jgi:hypothetical protein